MNNLIESAGLFPRIDSAYMDCVEDNLALLLLHLGQQDVRTPFACQWHFSFDEAQSMPVLCRDSFQRRIEEQTGYRVYQKDLDIARSGEVLSAYIQKGQPTLVFGDAFFMPWLPYFGQDHHEHSFIIDGMSDDRRFVHIVDAYENTTVWGKACPIACELPLTALPVILDLESEHAKACLWLEHRGEGEAPVLNLKDMLLVNARHMIASCQQEQLQHFAYYYHALMPDMEAAKKLEVALWLITRARSLHALWLRDLASRAPMLLPDFYADCYEQQVALAWKRVCEQAYLLMQRLKRGRSLPEGCFQLIEQTIAPQEAHLAERLLHHLENNV
jgi:hypothetical protein